MKTVLIVDDEEDMRQIVRMRLREPDFRVVEAASGPGALDLATREPPDLVILDWAIPGLSGIEVLKALRARPKLAGVPVIMVSGKDHPEDQKTARDAGAAAYLVKPFDMQALQDAIRLLLS